MAFDRKFWNRDFDTFSPRALEIILVEQTNVLNSLRQREIDLASNNSTETDFFPRALES